MKIWKKCGGGLVLLAGLTPLLTAQVPPPPPPVAPAAAPAAAPRNIWSFLCRTPEQKQACRDRLCNSKLGQFVNQGLKPAGVLSGGLIGPFCPGFTQEDLKKPADSAEGAAARIKKDEAEAKARRAAVRYLGTVDCHYWPEAQDALVNALRGDRNECVRWEAALALGSGCCCTPKTIEALSITVSGSEADGNPRETSERVRAAALGALEHCLARLGGPPPLDCPPPAPVPPREELPPPREKPPVEKAPGDPLSHYRNLDAVPMPQLVERARRAVGQNAAALRPVQATMSLPAAEPVTGPVDMSLLGIINRSVSAGKPAPEPPEPPKPKPAPAAAPPRPAGEVRPVGFQAPAPPGPGGLAVPAGNPYPMTVPPRPNPQPQPPAPPNRQSAAPAMPSGVLVASAAPAAGRNPLAERPQPTAPAPASGMFAVNPVQALRALRNAIEPEQREWAAVNLATVDWRAQPQVVDALLTAARKDLAPTVRVACIRSLMHMNVNTAAVVAALQALRADADPRVQREAARALECLAGPKGK
jgi:hypothetical protein